MEFQMRNQAFEVFHEVCLQGEHTDVTIKVQERDFKAHKIILCGCSPFFRMLFSTQWSRTEDSFSFQEISSDIMSLIIDFAYARPISITEDNVFELLVMADQFLISGLVETCCRFLEENLSPINCLSTLVFSKKFYSCSKIQHIAKLYVLQHFDEIIKVSQEFLEVPLDVLVEMFGQDELNVKEEETVFEAIIHWIEHLPEQRKNHIAELISKVRLCRISPEYFINKVKIHTFISENQECSNIIVHAMMTLLDNHDGPAVIDYDLINQLSRPRLPSVILLAIGGWSIGSPTNAIEAYDTRVNCWVNVTQEEEPPRAYHGAATLNGCVYCVGGFDSSTYFSSVRKFDPVTFSWNEVAPMYERRCYVSVAVLDRLLYAIGGFNGYNRLKTAERYDSGSNQWMLLSPMNERRSDASATSLHGKIYVCGGFTGIECLFTAESYNPETNQWSLIRPMSSRRSGVGVISFGDLIYAVGGFDGTNRLESAEVYDPSSNTWHDIESMINPRSNFGIEVMDDRLFVVGGFNGFRTCSKAEFYNQKTNEWVEARNMGISRSALSCCLISGIADVSRYVTDRDSLTIQEE